MAKRFIAFAGLSYYPLGGMNDVVGQFDTLEEAKKAVTDDRGKEVTDNPDYCEWGHVWDQETGGMYKYYLKDKES